MATFIYEVYCILIENQKGIHLIGLSLLMAFVFDLILMEIKKKKNGKEKLN